jgi:hypothetical protein
MMILRAMRNIARQLAWGAYGSAVEVKMPPDVTHAAEIG